MFISSSKTYENYLRTTIEQIKVVVLHLALTRSKSIVLAVNSRDSLRLTAYKMARASKMLRVIDRDICMKTATKMLAVYLAISLLVGANCIPLEEQLKDQPRPPAVAQPEQKPKPEAAVPQPLVPNPQPLVPNLPPQENAPLPPQENPSGEPLPQVPLPVGGAPPPGDLAESPDASPVERSGGSDLDTDATFWGGYGWGYRPYYGWGGYGYASPWRRWGGYGGGWGGRAYGGYGGGWGWGKGWGWGGRYWG